MHSIEKVCALEMEVLQALTASKDAEKKEGTTPMLHVILEHFSFEMQQLLDGYQSGTLTFPDLLAGYAQIGTEGHDLKPYEEILKYAQEHNESVKLHAGFIPRTYARTLMK